MYDKNDYELLYLITQNNKDAEEIMLDKYNLLVWKNVNLVYNDYVPLGIEKDDLYQEGRIALYNSFKAYDPNRNVPFYSFANICIRHSMIGYLRRFSSKANQLFYESISLDAYVADDVTIYNGEVISDDSCISALNQYDEQFGEMYLYCTEINNFEKNLLVLQVAGYSYLETAKRLHCSVKKVDNTLQKIKRILN